MAPSAAWISAAEQAPASAAMHPLARERLMNERRGRALGQSTPAVPAAAAAAASSFSPSPSSPSSSAAASAAAAAITTATTTTWEDGQYNRVRFMQGSAEFEWTPDRNHEPRQTWLKVRVKEEEGQGQDEDHAVALAAGREWKSTSFVELSRVSGVGTMCAENATVTLRFWDKAITQMFKDLDEYVKKRDIQLRLEVVGQIGEGPVAYSRWISASQLVAAAAQNQPPVTEEMLAAERQQRAEKERKKQLLLARKQREADDKVEKKKRDEERRVAREVEKKKQAEEEAQAEAAWAAEGWRSFSVSDESPACLQALKADFEGWYVRSAQEPTDAGGKQLIYRSRRDDSAQELWFDNESELNDALLRLCRLHPVNCQVNISPELRANFEGGLCTITSREDAAGFVRVKSAVRSTAKLPRCNIDHWDAEQHAFGVKSLKIYWKRLGSEPFPAWYRALSTSTTAAGMSASGGEDQPPTPATAMDTRDASDRRDSVQSEPGEVPCEPTVMNVKPEHPEHVLLAGQPLRQAELNMGTLKNKKIFIGDSNIVGADKGLFASQVFIPGDVITRFDGEPGTTGEFHRKSHLITLEGGTAGRHLDCYGICSQFTAASRLKSHCGVYEAGRNSYYPITDRYDNKSLYDAGLAAFANSSMGTDFVPNARVEKTKYTPRGRDGEATGYLPYAFLIATKRLEPGEEVLFEYEVVVDEEAPAASRNTRTTSAGASHEDGDIDMGGEEQHHEGVASIGVGGKKRQRSGDVAAGSSTKRHAVLPPARDNNSACARSASSTGTSASSAGVASGNSGSDGLFDLLERLGLSYLAPVFADEEIDLEALRLLKPTDYEALGIKMGPRVKLANALAMV